MNWLSYAAHIIYTIIFIIRKLYPLVISDDRLQSVTKIRTNDPWPGWTLPGNVVIMYCRAYNISYHWVHMMYPQYAIARHNIGEPYTSAFSVLETVM